MKNLLLIIGAVIALAVASAGVVVMNLGSATPAYADATDNGGGGK